MQQTNNTNNTNNTNQQMVEEDEIDLRELFATIWSYKKSIIIMTLLITIIAGIKIYKMPKYYKTTTTIEVKQKNGGGGISLGGAGALLGLAGIGGGGSNSIDKDAELMKTYRINAKVLEKVNYRVNLFINQKWKEVEIEESNCSVSISDLSVFDYRDYGMRVMLEPVSDEAFRLYLPSIVSDELLGEFEYGKPIHTEKFALTINKVRDGGVMPSFMTLNADSRYIHREMVSKNLTIEVEKKAPFLNISYLDTLPSRGEAYTKALIESYIEQSLQDEVDDIDITLNSLDKQIREVQDRVAISSRDLVKYKSKNQIISPEKQTGMLVKGQSDIEQTLISNLYKQKVVKRLIRATKNGKDIDTIAPSLVEIGDNPSIALISKLQELQLSEAGLAQDYKAAYPKLKSTRKQIKIVIAKIRSNLNNLKKVLSNRIKELQKQQKEYSTKLSSVPTMEKELSSVTTSYQLDEKIYGYLLQKKSAAEIKRAEALSRFRTIEDIYTSPRAAKPKKALMLIVTMITSFILMIFISFLREFIKGKPEE